MKSSAKLDRRTVKEIEQFLNDKRVQLRASVRTIVSERRTHEVDTNDDAQASENLHDEIQVVLVDQRSRQVAQIDAALERLSRGQYGICLDCNEFIGLPRLRALPFAQRCRACQTDVEIRARRTTERVSACVAIEAA